MPRMTHFLTLSLWAPMLLMTSLRAQQPTPGNLQASATAPTSVSLTWTAAAGANGYIVQRAIGSNPFDRLTADKIHVTAYTDAAAPAGTALRYRIKAVFGNSQSSLSAIANVTTPNAPANTASSGTSSTPTPGQPTMQPATTGASSQTTVRAGAVPLKAYSAPSGTTSGVTLSAASPTPASAPAPATPTAADPGGFTATLQGNKVTLSWQAVPGIAWYLLGGPGMGQYGQQVQGTSYTFDSPGPGQHEWTVASLAGQGQGPVNNWVGWPKAALRIESLTGNYRVTVAGLRSEHATVDDWWSRDGKWDEVYVSAFVQTFDRPSGQLLASVTLKSPVHGDINGFPPGSRVRAGTASDLGGIVTGDQVSPVLAQPAPGAGGYPLLILWQGTLTSDHEVVVIHPVLWEADNGDRNTAAYNQWTGYFSTPAREWALPDVQHPDPQASTWFREGGLVRLGGAVDQMLGLDRNDQDRPIGVRSEHGCYGTSGTCGSWTDHMLILTRERIERALSGAYASGDKGLLELRLSDYYQVTNGARTGSDLQGDYVMLLKVERAP